MQHRPLTLELSGAGRKVCKNMSDGPASALNEQLGRLYTKRGVWKAATWLVRAPRRTNVMLELANGCCRRFAHDQQDGAKADLATRRAELARGRSTPDKLEGAKADSAAKPPALPRSMDAKRTRHATATVHLNRKCSWPPNANSAPDQRR